jgi:hemerythrin HHE cation binding domain-containing protein
MESPARGVRFIHTAIEREAEEIERLAAAGEAAAVAERLPLFKRVLALHTGGEEDSIFKDIDAHLPDVTAAYVLDHREEEERFAALERAAADGAPQPLYRAAAALRDHLRLHIRKENELLIPIVERLYSPAEQGAQIARMMAAFAPADFAAVLPWLIEWLDPVDRRAYLGIVEAAAPPERFAAVLGMVRAGVSPGVWATLER